MNSDDPSLLLTYESFFGLREKPFSLSANPRFFFRNASRGAAFDALINGIRRREGILVVTGEVGTGKTTLSRAVLESLDRRTLAAFVPDPNLTREELLKTLLLDYGVVSVDEIRSNRFRDTNRMELNYLLMNFLRSLQPLQGIALLMIDEAQNVPSSLLEELRILSDLEDARTGQKLLQLLLIGQPELQARLATPEMRQLTQRLSVRCELQPFSREDIVPYIVHRLAIAGNSEVLIEEKALQLISAVSLGVPRVINLLCDGALARAARMGSPGVAAEHVAGAAQDLRIPVPNVGPLWHRPAGQLESGPPLPRVVPPAVGRLVAEIKPPSVIGFQPVPPAPAPGGRPLMRQDFRPEFASPPPDIEPVPVPAAPITQVAPPAIAPPAAAPPPPASVRDVLSLRNFPGQIGTVMASVPPVEPVEARGSAPAFLVERPVPSSRVRGIRFEDRGSSHRPWLIFGACAVITAALAAYLSLNVRPSTAAVSTNPQTAGASTPATAVRPTAAPATEARSAYLIEAATFQSSIEMIESVALFRGGGYAASARQEMTPDGKPTFTVFVGPYPSRTAAEEALTAVQRLPGYENSRVVPSASPQ